MNISSAAFNIDLLILSKDDVKNIRPVKVLDIFSASSRNFHPDGLFSIETFGKVGEALRNRLFSYIDFHITVFHPVIYKALCDLKGLYGEILAGRSYAIFDTATKDFVKSDPLKGDTGYQFFVSHFHELQFEERPSSKREFNIKLIEKYRSNCLMDKLVVMPAGLRDYSIDDNGKPSEDEINNMYRKVMSICSMVENVNHKVNPEYLDSARFNIQLAIQDIYNYIKNMLEGKSALILGKFAARKVFNSTRNVITSYIPDGDELHGSKTVSTTQSVVGLYQYMRAILPLAVKHVRDGFLSKVFIGPNSPAMLVNKKTLKKEMVSLDPDYYDEWMTYEGLEKVMARYGEENLRHEPIDIDGYWLGLIYNDGESYRFVQDVSELPSGHNKEYLSPVTYTELLYLSVYKDSSSTPCFVTRYPIAGYGGIYPGYTYLKTTVKSQVLKELDEDWKPTGIVANEFPIIGEQFYNSLSPASKHLARLSADFDGDVCSYTCVLSDQARAEVKKTLSSRSMYVDVSGKMAFSASNDIIDLVLVSMTGA